MPVFLTYDGSVNTDWIAHYALRMAAHTAERQLTVVYIEDAEVPAPRLLAGLKAIANQADDLGVAVINEILPMRNGILGGLTDYLPAGPESIVVCGTRVRKGRRGFLRGTISEQLMRLHRYQVLALRVVQPGLLGQPHRVLAPVAGKPEGFLHSLPILQLLAPEITRLHLLRVVQRRRNILHRLTTAKAGQLRQEALDQLRDIETRIRARIDMPGDAIELLARIAPDWPDEAILQANYLRSEMIFVEASRRGLARNIMPARPIETLLANANCDVAVFRGID